MRLPLLLGMLILALSLGSWSGGALAASDDLSDAAHAAFGRGEAGPLLPHLPRGGTLTIDAPAAGVPRASYGERQARSVLDRIFSRFPGGTFEIVSGRGGGVIVGRWTARSSRATAATALDVTLVRTGATLREIRISR